MSLIVSSVDFPLGPDVLGKRLRMVPQIAFVSRIADVISAFE
jgi:hypothetical protein